MTSKKQVPRSFDLCECCIIAPVMGCPLPGVLIMQDGEVQACGTCQLYAGDQEAGQALVDHLNGALPRAKFGFFALLLIPMVGDGPTGEERISIQLALSKDYDHRYKELSLKQSRRVEQANIAAAAAKKGKL